LPNKQTNGMKRSKVEVTKVRQNHTLSFKCVNPFVTLDMPKEKL